MDVAQIYMLALRPTMIPIAGESWSAMPFYGQVELEGWSWNLVNAEEKVTNQRNRSEAQKKAGDASTDPAEAVKASFKRKRDDVADRADIRDYARMKATRDSERAAQLRRQERGENISKEDAKRIDGLDSKLEEILNRRNTRANASSASLTKASESDADRASRKQTEDENEELSREEAIAQAQAENFEFTFRKRVDISTTQLLNCLKAGDKLPTVTLTMHQSSSNTPWVLVFTLTGVRLKDYKVKVEMSDTMTDMKEEWSAEFEHFGYVYQNRPHAGLKSVTAGHVNTQVARAATQMTVRTFAMRPRRLSLGL